MNETLFRFAIVVALLIPAAARAQMPETAFAAEARFGISGNGIHPSLIVGGRLVGRVQLGLGFDLVRVSPGDPNNTTTTTFAFAPEVSVDILKSHDNHVAWYGRAALPLGARVLATGGLGGGANTTVFAIGYEAALGARYCPHPHFAVGVEGGVLGIFVDPGATSAAGSGTTAFYGAVVGTFYWAR